METEEEFFKNSGTNEISENKVLKNGNEHNAESKVMYQCPMKCQGEEVYDEPGICPDSKMQMIPVNGGHIFY